MQENEVVNGNKEEYEQTSDKWYICNSNAKL